MNNDSLLGLVPEKNDSMLAYRIFQEQMIIVFNPLTGKYILEITPEETAKADLLITRVTGDKKPRTQSRELNLGKRKKIRLVINYHPDVDLDLKVE